LKTRRRSLSRRSSKVSIPILAPLARLLTSAVKCYEVQISLPVYKIFSDKRGKQSGSSCLRIAANKKFQVAARLGLVVSPSPAYV